MTTLSLPTLYTCPGEEHPISRSVHLSRLAAFYPKCRDCQHRDDTGHLPQETVERLQSTEKRVERPTLFTIDGVRGIYLNELNRNRAAQMAASFASLLWADFTMQGRVCDEFNSSSLGISRHPRPTVVVGYDERPSSPDIATGVVTSLRRMGCHVIDINLTTRPCFCFAVDHLKATGGILVTGSGCDPSWTGLDFVGRHASPYSIGAGLESIESGFLQGSSRPTRQAGQHRIFQPTLPYEAGLWKHFHALRPLRIVCGCPVRLVRETLTKVFETLPCQLTFVEVADRRRDWQVPNDQDVSQVSQAVISKTAHFGILIDNDGCKCAFLDEHGRLISPNDITALMTELLLSETTNSVIAIGHDDLSFRQTLEGLGASVRETAATLASSYQALQDETCILAAGNHGRYWIQESIPTCDAILSLARMLQVLSQSDSQVSELVSRLAG